jgi:hypothetical protein
MKVAVALATLLILLISISSLVPSGSISWTHRPATHVGPGRSKNWAGYAVQTSLASPQKSAVTDIKASWIVPMVACQDTPDGWSSFWVGMDGYSSSTVEQTGIDAICKSGWAPMYYAWYEMFPEPYVVITSMTIIPGHPVSAEVRYLGSAKFELTITDVMTGITFTTTQTSKIAERSSAEWIAEAPGIPTLPLAKFLTVTFQNAQATLKGHTGPINDPAWEYDRIDMAWSSGLIRAEALPLSLDGTCFSVKWVRLWTYFLCKERRLLSLGLGRHHLETILILHQPQFGS